MSEARGGRPDFSAAGPVAYNPEGEAAGRWEGGPIDPGTEARLLSIDGVVSVGIGSDHEGSEVVVVGVTHAEVASRLPRQVSGRAVTTQVTGPVNALRA